MPAATATNSSKGATRTGTRARSKRVTVSADQRRQMIEETAYLRAEQRGFNGGDPVADWLLSEREVDELLSKNAH